MNSANNYVVYCNLYRDVPIKNLFTFKFNVTLMWLESYLYFLRLKCVSNDYGLFHLP